MSAYAGLLIIFVVTILSCFVILRQKHSRKPTASDWPSTVAHLSNSRVIEDAGPEATTYSLRLELKYNVGNRDFSAIATEEFESSTAAMDFLEGLGNGPLLIYYDPQNPRCISMNREPLSIAPRS